MKMALKRPRTPSTAIPTMRKGSKRSHTSGYRMRASKAIGQHRIKRIIHKKKAAMATSLVAQQSSPRMAEPPNRSLFQTLRD
jgi:hypothetical protein